MPLRNATDKTPVVWVIKPGGNFYPAPLAANINDGVVMLVDGIPTIRPKAKAAGYMFVSEGCDSPEQAEMVTRYLNESLGKPRFVPLPDEHLPRICRLRRAENKEKLGFDFGSFGDMAKDESKPKASKAK